jgi:hypothetical protein
VTGTGKNHLVLSSQLLATMSLPKLTSLSTQTLSLLLERQRLQSLSPAGATNGLTSSLHIPQITRNLAQLRSGILELESTGEHSEAVAILRNQHARMCGMVGTDAVFEPLPEPTAGSSGTQEVEETRRTRTPLGSENPKKAWPSVGEHDFTPYSDDPEAGRDPAFLLQEQRRLMDGAYHVSLTASEIAPSQREYRSGCTFRYPLALNYPPARPFDADQRRARRTHWVVGRAGS